jgi:hypothetical protein
LSPASRSLGIYTNLAKKVATSAHPCASVETYGVVRVTRTPEAARTARGDFGG